MTRIGSTRLPSGLGAAAFRVGSRLSLRDAGGAADDEHVSDAQYEAVLTALEARGYRDVGEIELEHGRIEADAVHPDGHEVDLELDPESLEILSEERD